MELISAEDEVDGPFFHFFLMTMRRKKKKI